LNDFVLSYKVWVDRGTLGLPVDGSIGWSPALGLHTIAGILPAPGCIPMGWVEGETWLELSLKPSR